MSSITQAINPPHVAPSATQVFSDAKVDDNLEKKSGDDKSKTDFKTLITNSVDEMKKDRKAKENGDLSSSSDAEFLEKLSNQTKEKRQPKNELGKDDFMKLFVTQLQHQNPMNPDDGAEMASKLAQFNALEQMMNVNKGIEKLTTQQSTAQNMQMMNYIGKEVTVDGGRVRLENGNITHSEFSAQAPVAAATLEIRGADGMLINQIDLGAMDAGTHDLPWDGMRSDGKPAGDGIYTFNVTARNMEGDNVPINIQSKARITGVDIKAKDGALFSDFGKVTFDQIRSVGLVGYDVENQKANAPGAAPAGANPAVGAAAPTGQAPATAATGPAAPNSPVASLQGLSQAAPAVLPGMPGAPADKSLATPPQYGAAKTSAMEQKSSPKSPSQVADSLDRMKAEGKLDLKKSQEASTKQAQVNANATAELAKARAKANAAVASSDSKAAASAMSSGKDSGKAANTAKTPAAS